MTLFKRVIPLVGLTLLSSSLLAAPYEFRLPFGAFSSASIVPAPAEPTLAERITIWSDFLAIHANIPFDWSTANIDLDDSGFVGAPADQDYTLGSGNFPNVPFPAASFEEMVLTFSGITNIEALSSITTVTQNLVLTDLAATSLVGLRNLVSVGGYLEITYSNITDLSGLESLTSVGEDLSLEGNNLQNLNPLTSLTFASYINIHLNPNLTDISGIKNVSGVIRLKSASSQVYAVKVPASSQLCIDIGTGTTIVDFVAGGPLSPALGLAHICTP